MSNSKASEAEKAETHNSEPLICGIVRPISPAEDCTEAHWVDVERIIKEALKDTGFEGRLVSMADDSGVIHARIVQNLADDQMVICDVSTRNPNVMFELGMRLAFDMPTIVIKDEMTKNPFDIAPIEYVPYPRDLNYYAIHTFKSELAKKVAATYEASKKPDHPTFLKHFKRFTSKKSLPTESVAVPQQVIDLLEEIRTQNAAFRQQNSPPTIRREIGANRSDATYFLKGIPTDWEGFMAATLQINVPLRSIVNVAADIHIVKATPFSAEETFRFAKLAGQYGMTFQREN